jgi:hypothetical protein
MVHERLVAMGFTGTDRTTRRAVARAKAAWRAGHRRKYRPWVLTELREQVPLVRGADLVLGWIPSLLVIEQEDPRRDLGSLVVSRLG